MKRYVLIVAGGKGLRMGGNLPKQFIAIGGRPVLMHTLERFCRWDANAECILVLPAGQAECWKHLCEDFHCSAPHRLAEGGETRFHSVRNGLALLNDNGWVAVHDGVRPFVASQVIDNCFAAAERYGASVPILPVTDSLLHRNDDGTHHPVERSRFFVVQTPQVFRSEWILDAYRQHYTPAFTDDASVVQAAGYPICTVPGNRENIKITNPLDLQVAEALLNRPPD
ncbi:MAG: 2-C-methyl-D-erythritol 4-phosphate cytidylyltransferase [Tannerellaceae bacterium]|jgi:2-C-methyl-D-erythritol 4-phosphate cytidylyltransferase|nr:2-C-methyl-D-erythritol 4-phosphate cytidylyltransferase [Tannerellaceae bacterium]